MIVCSPFVNLIMTAKVASEYISDCVGNVGTKRSNSRQEKECYYFSELENGDVIRVSRKGGLYDHYGIYVEGGHHVIHYTGTDGATDFNGTVRETSFDRFLDGANSVVLCCFPQTIRSLDELSVYKAPLEKVRDLAALQFQKEPMRTLKGAVELVCGGLKVVKVSSRVFEVSHEDEETRLGDYHLYSGKEIVERARSQIGENAYNLALNNCEHFAIWCKTGLRESSQVNGIINSIRALV